MSTATKTARTLITRGTSNAAFTQLTGCSVTRSTTTATLTKTSHGLSNGDKVLIQGFSLDEFNGVFTVANSAANTFDYTITADPGANPTGTPGTVDKVTLGTAVDLSTAYGLDIVVEIQNTTTGPTIAPQVWMGVSATSAAADYLWRQVAIGDLTANALTVVPIRLGPNTMFVNVAVCHNTGQAVDCTAIGTEFTSS